ncbi:hypothetical protein CLV55_103209 [Flavobacterium aciduliphilum]|uniref:DUF6980 domain-containing protein n=1 Tax=Flavobacterium aciduliphilum TaxID=1101402 RepID=A0A328YIV0_9FLAO|nr:hypothetical protein CLV55_103209 [Flavobacterium aciduliphilum]
MEKEACCETMKYHINYKCDIHKNPFDCPDAVIYSSKKRKSLV